MSTRNPGGSSSSYTSHGHGGGPSPSSPFQGNSSHIANTVDSHIAAARRGSLVTSSSLHVTGLTRVSRMPVFVQRIFRPLRMVLLLLDHSHNNCCPDFRPHLSQSPPQSSPSYAEPEQVNVNSIGLAPPTPTGGLAFVTRNDAPVSEE